MKTFSLALIASAATARGISGGINTSHIPYSGTIGSKYGYGYNIGNGFTHGDQHGNYMGHQNTVHAGSGAGHVLDFTAQNAHDHIIGYDSVAAYPDTTWDTTFAGQMSTAATAIKTIIGTINTARSTYIGTVMDLRQNRLDDIHDDNLLKVEAPFQLQLDLLEKEVADVGKAKAYAEDDAAKAWTDLQERMNDYLDDRIEALTIEADRVARVLERAVEDSKPVQDVLYAMRLDWLQGIYVSGNSVYFDDQVFDMQVYDDEFDLFTYDIGHGKGHGHTNQGVMSPGNLGEQGFVVGAGVGDRDIRKLRGKPRAVDGKRRRYDKQTMSGSRNDYGRGVAIGQRGGRFEFNEAASLQVAGDESGQDAQQYGRPKRGVRRARGGQRQRKSTAGRSRRAAGYGQKPSGGSRKAPSYQKTKQVSKRTSYDDYHRMPAGGYGYRGGSAGAY